MVALPGEGRVVGKPIAKPAVMVGFFNMKGEDLENLDIQIRKIETIQRRTK